MKVIIVKTKLQLESLSVSSLFDYNEELQEVNSRILMTILTQLTIFTMPLVLIQLEEFFRLVC